MWAPNLVDADDWQLVTRMSAVLSWHVEPPWAVAFFLALGLPRTAREPCAFEAKFLGFDKSGSQTGTGSGAGPQPRYFAASSGSANSGLCIVLTGFPVILLRARVSALWENWS